MKLTPQQALLAGLIVLFALAYYFREQVGVIVADYAGKYWPLPKAGEPYADLIKAASISSGVPFDLIARELEDESGFDPNALNQDSGAIGIAQFEPATAAELGIDPKDPAQAIPGMGRYLAQVRSYIDNHIDPPVTWAMTLAGYDWGEGHVVSVVNKFGDQWLANAPEETQKYVGKILSSVPLEPLPAGAIA